MLLLFMLYFKVKYKDFITIVKNHQCKNLITELADTNDIQYINKISYIVKLFKQCSISNIESVPPPVYDSYDSAHKPDK